MTTVFQRDEFDPTIYHRIETAMPVRSCGRFVVRCDRKGQWPVEYGVMVNGEVLCWTRPETKQERQAREAEAQRISNENWEQYEAYTQQWSLWDNGGRKGPEPVCPDSQDVPSDVRVVRDVQAALLARGLRALNTADWNGLRVLDGI